MECEIELREGDKFIAVYPADAYSVSYSINFPHPLIGKQSFCVRLTNGSYLNEIAPARTFGFLHEADAMRQQGLISGARWRWRVFGFFLIKPAPCGRRD